MLPDLYLWAGSIQPSPNAFLHAVKCVYPGYIPPLLPILAAYPHGRHDRGLDFDHGAAISVPASQRGDWYPWGLAR